MARGNTWTNNDGLQVGFGTRDTNNFEGASIRTTGRVNQLVIELGFGNFPTSAGTAPSSKEFKIPAGSLIQSSSLVVSSAFVGGTSIGIGLKNSAGTDIDADGIDAAIATAVVNAVGKVVQNDGALVGGVLTVGTADAYLSSVIVGTYTAGRGTLTIEYVLPEA